MKQKANTRSIFEHIDTTHESSIWAVTRSARRAFLPSVTLAIYWGL